MSNFEISAPVAFKTSTPDWMIFDIDDVESALPDPHDEYVDWHDIFENDTPFQGFDIPPLRGHVPQDLVNVNLRHIKNHSQIGPKMSDLYAML